MEKWLRSLSKTTALILGIVVAGAIVAFYVVLGSSFNGFLSIIVLCALLGGGIGFCVPLLFKGVTGQTPQERKESQRGS